MDKVTVTVDGKTLQITHPEKVFWPELNVTKFDYIQYLIRMSPYIIPAMAERLSMFWCYPDGIKGKGYARKSRPSFAPEWLKGVPYQDSTRLCVNDTATLVFAGNYAALELHVEPDRLTQPGYPSYLAIDLDPSVPDRFDEVLEVARTVRDVLHSIQLDAVPKTSGATGLHVYVPIREAYTFTDARRVNQLIAEYVAAKLPNIVTLDRVVKRRGVKLYFDFLQLWQGKTMAAAYAARATPTATVSTPVTWSEVDQGFHPSQYTILTVPDRVQRIGDLFTPIVTGKNRYDLSPILKFLDAHRR